MKTALSERLNLRFPLIQAPMAGVSTPALAAAVTNAGGLGSLGVGASDVKQAEDMLAQTRQLTSGPLNINLFCHSAARRFPLKEQQWITALRPLLDRYGAPPVHELREIYRSFHQSPEMADMLLTCRPEVVSFHFGLPAPAMISRFKQQGILTLASVTNVAEAAEAEAAGIDFMVAQGYEAGGHRGIFDPSAADDRLPALSLLRLLKQRCRTPIIAAGGVMDGGTISTMLRAGADAVQLGTAFLLCPESATDQAWRQALQPENIRGTTMTPAISGRPARSLINRLCDYTRDFPAEQIPDYPLTYSLSKTLAAAAAAKGEPFYGAQWAGEGVRAIRSLPAAELVALLIREATPAADIPAG